MKIEDIRTIINDKINELNKILDSIKTYDRDVNIIDCSHLHHSARFSVQ